MAERQLQLHRQASGNGPGGRWARFHVIDQAGDVVGEIVEHHDVRVEYIATAGQAGESQFRSYGHGTAALALDALAQYLRDAG